MNKDYDIEYYDSYYDDEENIESKREAKFAKTNRRLFSKKRRDSEEHIAKEIEIENKRQTKRNEKESFFER